METNELHATQIEFDSLVESIQASDLLLAEKDSLRALLKAAYRNTNGDPPEEKMKLMCAFDWELSKQIVHLRMLLTSFLKAGKQRAGSKWERIVDALPLWRNQIAAVLIAFAFAPHGVDIVNAIRGFVK